MVLVECLAAALTQSHPWVAFVAPAVPWVGSGRGHLVQAAESFSYQLEDRDADVERLSGHGFLLYMEKPLGKPRAG
jgi:hypothetical protein